MKAKLSWSWALIRETFQEWNNDNAFRLSAALSYYTVFSLAPLIILATAIAGFVFGDEAIRGELSSQLRGLLGREGAEAIEGIVVSARKPTTGIIATITGILVLIIGSTGVFTELKSALNQIWNIPPSKTFSGVKGLVLERLLSFAMVASVGFLLLVSLVANTVLAAATKYLSDILPIPGIAVQLAYNLVSVLIVTLLFAMLYRVLPDKPIAWRDTWIGAFITAVLFSLGKFLIGLYLGQSSITSAFGASASLALILAWAYYSSLIFFLGAEFTEVYSRRRKSTSTSRQKGPPLPATQPHALHVTAKPYAEETDPDDGARTIAATAPFAISPKVFCLQRPA